MWQWFKDGGIDAAPLQRSVTVVFCLTPAATHQREKKKKKKYGCSYVAEHIFFLHAHALTMRQKIPLTRLCKADRLLASDENRLREELKMAKAERKVRRNFDIIL